MIKVKKGIESIAEREIYAESENSNGFLGISVGAFVGGALGFSVAELQDYNQNAQMLVVVTGMLVGGCIARSISYSNPKKKSIDNNDSSETIVEGLLKNEEFIGFKKNLFNKIVSRFSDEFSKNPSIVITAFSAAFDPLITKISSVASSVDIVGAIGFSKVSFGSAVGHAVYAAPLIIEVAAVSSAIAVLGYMAYSYVKKEQKNIELKYKELSIAEKKLEENYNKLHQSVLAIADEGQKKELNKLYRKFMEEYTTVGIKRDTLEKIGLFHDSIVRNKNRLIATQIKELSDKLIESISKCNEISTKEKSFVEKSMSFIENYR